jgi:hypothetical protein
LRLLGFEPEYGDVFQVLETEVGNVVGIFGTVGGSLPLPGLGLAVVYGPKAVRVVAAIPGDANLDGSVNIADLGILAGNWQGSGKTWVDGDFNGDGEVTIADLGVLAAHWQLNDRYWFHGDFNYDGSVTIADLGILAANWQAGVTPGSGGFSFGEAMAMFDVFNGVVIPEPGALSLLGLGLLALKRRRRQ